MASLNANLIYSSVVGFGVDPLVNPPIFCPFKVKLISERVIDSEDEQERLRPLTPKDCPDNVSTTVKKYNYNIFRNTTLLCNVQSSIIMN